MENTKIRQRLYQELIEWFAEQGIKSTLIKLLGYSRGNIDYLRAKAPLIKGWPAIESICEATVKLIFHGI